MGTVDTGTVIVVTGTVVVVVVVGVIEVGGTVDTGTVVAASIIAVSIGVVVVGETVDTGTVVVGGTVRKEGTGTVSTAVGTGTVVAVSVTAVSTGTVVGGTGKRISVFGMAVEFDPKKSHSVPIFLTTLSLKFKSVFSSPNPLSFPESTTESLLKVEEIFPYVPCVRKVSIVSFAISEV